MDITKESNSIDQLIGKIELVLGYELSPDKHNQLAEIILDDRCECNKILSEQIYKTKP